MKPKFQPGDTVVVTQIILGADRFKELIGSEYRVNKVLRWDPYRKMHTYELQYRPGECWLEDELVECQQDELIVPSAASLAGLFG